MAFEIVFKEEAKRDISDAMQWYVSKAENLDKKFLLAVEETLIRIKQNPFAFKKVYKNSGKLLLRSFRMLYFMNPNKELLLYMLFSIHGNILQKNFNG